MTDLIQSRAAGRGSSMASPTRRRASSSEALAFPSMAAPSAAAAHSKA
ncbi:MAG: hypothetical protein HZY76_09865 [Anaerolineae bacterium]|nr:MAG: hypothetical protein HZY76_09865 [Anaerolineae bacterium]